MSKINRFLLLSSFFAVSFMHATTNVNATTRMAPIRSSINDFVFSSHGSGYNNPKAFQAMAHRAHQRAQEEKHKFWLFDEIAFFFEMLWEELTGHHFNHDQSSSTDATNAENIDNTTDSLVDATTENPEPLTADEPADITADAPAPIATDAPAPIATDITTDTPADIVADITTDITYTEEFSEEQESMANEEIQAEEAFNLAEEAEESEAAEECNYQDIITNIAENTAHYHEEEIALENLLELEQAMFGYLQETNSIVEEITSAASATAEESDQFFEDDFDSLIYHLDDEIIEIIIQDMLESFFQPYEYDEEISRTARHDEVVEKARKVIVAIRNAARTLHA